MEELLPSVVSYIAIRSSTKNTMLKAYAKISSTSQNLFLKGINGYSSVILYNIIISIEYRAYVVIQTLFFFEGYDR